MTLAMPDSTDTRNLPAGYPAYLGYVDGRWPTIYGYTAPDGTHVPALSARFPAAYHVGLTVTGATLNADGIDVEEKNPDAAGGATWVMRKLTAAPGSRPVAYADLATPGYTMREIYARLTAAGIPRAHYRLLTAHYTYHAHICGPASCGGLAIDADGTQWTDRAQGALGILIDMSELRDDFFTGGTMTTPELKPITVLPPGSWHTAVLTGTAGGETYTATWDGKQWHQVAWPVKPAT